MADHGWDKPANVGVTGGEDATRHEALEAEGIDPFTGKGALLEADATTAFKTIDALWRRQETIARNRLAMDKHWTALKSGYTFSSLTKADNQDTYTQSWPPGYGASLRIGAVPNKQADLCNKLVETLLVDPPKLDPEATTDDESAKRASDLAREFLLQDGTEAGTDDLTLFAHQLEAATTRASTFNHYWVDAHGNGSIPKQVKAHPLATDPANPLDAVDQRTGLPIPTTDYVLRYVTPDNQFTENPLEAERVWLPKIRVDKLYREHVRLYPEQADLHGADKAIVCYFDSVNGAKRRFPEFFEDADESTIDKLVAWEPQRPAVLLPPALRARFRKGKETPDVSGYANDERFVFFYLYYQVACPEYPEGAVLAVNGADGGTILHKDTLSAIVEMPSGVEQDAVVKDVRALDIPLVQNRLLPDTDEGDPMGKAFMSRIGGPGEATATLAAAMLEAIDITLHPARYAVATSPVSAEDVESSRATGDFVTVLSNNDFPKYEEPRNLPSAFFPFYEGMLGAMDAVAGLNKPAQGSDDSKEVSGVARRIAVQQSLVSLSRMQQAVHNAFTRHGRIKLQQAMKHFGTAQLLKFVGPDGVAKQEWFTGADFSRVGNVMIQSGSGTMLPPTERVNYVLQLRDAQLIDADETMEVARPAFAKSLGAPTNPHIQRIERQISSWLEGPPAEWEAEAIAFEQAVAEHAVLAQQAAESGQEIPPEPPAPWTPFATEPVDFEPAVAALRKRRLGHLLAKVEFSAQPPAWQNLVRHAYTEMAQAAQPAPMPQQRGAQVATPSEQPVNLTA